MAHTLLITVRANDVCHTHTFDGTMQSVLWLGPAARAAHDDAWCCIESGGPAVVLRAIADASIVLQSDPTRENNYVSLASDDECICYVRRADEIITIHVRPVRPGMSDFSVLRVTQDVEIEVGRGRASTVRYHNRLVSMRHARIRVRDGGFQVCDLQSANGTYLNGRRLVPAQPVELKPGDVVQILDVTMCVGKGLLCINHPEDVSFSRVDGLVPLEHETNELAGLRDGAHAVPSAEVTYVGDSHASGDEGHGERAPFYPAPRLTKSIHPLVLEVDDPPAKCEEDRQPALMQIGPSFLMGISSVFMAMSSISRMMAGDAVLQVAPSLAMAVAMVGGSVIWPLVSRSYTRKRTRRDEMLRAQTYVAYLDGIENVLARETEHQAQILAENRRPVVELLERAASLSPLLMNRTSVHDDFMELRVGIGDANVRAEVTWPKRRFTLVEDPMLDRVASLARNPPTLRNVPLAFNAAQHYVAGVLGERAQAWGFVRGLVVQACALYSYRDLKVMLVADERERQEWDFLDSLEHFYDARGAQRLVALHYAGMVELDQLIEAELAARAGERAEVLGDFGTYYLIVCANIALAERSEAIARIIKLRTNHGFSVVYVGRDLRDLPRECAYLIDLMPKGGIGLGISLDGADVAHDRRARMFERVDVSGTLAPFDPDVFVSREHARKFALNLARARLDAGERQQVMPESLRFLEMYEAGSVEHLNIGQRWAEHDASHSLQACVGVDGRGELAYLDLHENIHGPHALIAGTTGSGKSEFIITYVLSLCVTYAPTEVSFVLIDYKGGGLTGAFENERHRLPHLAGSITNLDGNAIRRSLVSLQSELRRRQRLLREACERTGESTMDIYKYLSFFRQGMLAQPLPHLFVVADEFAELKQQEPEFMEELVSAARIGRSLGIHLILATQKPSGVVDDQIWSNARAKVSLKVSDVADSREMLRRDDAASIVRPGMYYLLVGYNESFSCGQAAYAGSTYVATKQFEQRRDQMVELLDAEGIVVATQRVMPRSAIGKRSELDVVLEQIEECAKTTKCQAHPLWLAPVPALVTLADLRDRYGDVTPSGMTCVVGELDDPERQRKLRFEVDLACAGNVMMYGSPASDVDGLLAAMLFSLASNHGADSLWVYGIDAGPGELRALESLPQVGGMARSDDEERVNNLIRMLEQELLRRRNRCMEQKVDVSAFSHVVVTIANLGAFLDVFSSLEDRLVALTRDAPRYGMSFIVTAMAAGTPRMRLKANFGMAIVAMLNDEGDYATILGGDTRRVGLPHGERRGLVRIDKRILEFQGVRIAETRDEERALREALALRCEHEAPNLRAPAIPVLPEHVTYEHMEPGATRTDSRLVPVGFLREEVAPVFFDFGASNTMLVLGDDIEAIGSYLRGMCEAWGQMGREDVCFVDPQHVLGLVNDARVLQDADEVCSFVRELESGGACARVVVCTSIVQTMNSLPAEERAMFEAYVARERDAAERSFVFATEHWRTKGLYSDWYRVVSAYGNGVWAGSGFADQTTFRFARALPEYRQAQFSQDGFLVVRGSVKAVRLVEASFTHTKGGE